MGIPFTQYLRPDGRKRHTEISRSANIELLAQEIRAKGYNFESEELSNGLVSLTVVSPNENEGEVAIKLCRNGPNVPSAIDLLVREAYVLVVGNRGAGPKRRREK